MLKQNTLNPFHSTLFKVKPRKDSNVKARYDAIADTWDNKLKRIGMQYVYQNLFDDLSQQYLLPKDMGRVLDIGIGTGALSKALLDGRFYVQELVGIDISQQMLTVAQEYLASYPINMELYQDDMNAWQTTSDAFDFIISAHTLEHLNNPPQIIQQIYESLSDNGAFLLIMTRASLWGRYIRHQWKDIHLATPERAEEWLKDAGFKSVQRMRLGGNLVSPLGSLAIIAHK